jgi:hypothetical protein
MHVTSHDLRHWLCTEPASALCQPALLPPDWLTTVEAEASLHYGAFLRYRHGTRHYWDAHQVLVGIRIALAAQGYTPTYHRDTATVTFAPTDTA